MNHTMTMTTDVVGDHAELTLADETPYMSYGTRFTARSKVTTTTGTHGTVMLAMVAAGSLLGMAPDGEQLGLAHAVTHMTPDEARAIAHALIIAADAAEVAA
jgi:hypothetical protein